MTETAVIVRPAGEPAPDLTDYRVVHRAMAIDLARLTRAAAELAERHDPARMAALRYYLRAVFGEIASHHHVEDEQVWPLLVSVAGDRIALVPLTDDHDRLDPLLHGRPRSPPATGPPPRWRPPSARSPSCWSGTSPTRSGTCSR
jgi:hypothetical protein